MVFQIQLSSCFSSSHRSHAVFSKPSLSCSGIVIVTIIIKAKLFSEIITEKRSAFSRICKYNVVSFSKIKTPSATSTLPKRN